MSPLKIHSPVFLSEPVYIGYYHIIFDGLRQEKTFRQAVFRHIGYLQAERIHRGLYQNFPVLHKDFPAVRPVKAE